MIFYNGIIIKKTTNWRSSVSKYFKSYFIIPRLISKQRNTSNFKFPAYFLAIKSSGSSNVISQSSVTTIPFTTMTNMTLSSEASSSSMPESTAQSTLFQTLSESNPSAVFSSEGNLFLW